MNKCTCKIEQRWKTGETLHNDAVRRLFNLQITIIYHGLHHGIVAEMWSIHIKFYYIINVNVDMYQMKNRIKL